MTQSGIELTDEQARRLRSELIGWLATVRADGQPQPVPVWFLWDGSAFLIYSRPRNQKLVNIAANPRASLHLNSGADGGHILRFDGTAQVDPNAPPADEVPQYLEKYGDAITRIGMTPRSFAEAYSVALRLSPSRTYGH